MSQNSKIIVISNDRMFSARAEKVAKNFAVEFEAFENEEFYSDKVAQHERTDFVIVSALAKSQQEIAGYVQMAKFVAPKSCVAVVVDKKMSSESVSFIKKSGASMIMLEEEFLKHSKIEFVYSQNAHGDMIPIKSSELMAGINVNFGVFHILPLNQKILPVIRSGDILDQNKIDKMNSVGEFYIKREDVDNYASWVEKNVDRSAKGLKGRCRAQFLNLAVTYKNLVNLITDRSELASFKKGKELIDKCAELAKNLVTSLSDSGDAWDVVNLSSMADFTPLDRAPAMAAYAGIASLLTGIGDPDQVMVAAMLADIGLLELSSEGAQLFLANGAEAAFGPDDNQVYRQHPLVSLNVCLERKLPVPEKLKEVILCTHEMPNGKGFPNAKFNKIPLESQLIRFCEKLDRSTRVELGRGRIDPKEVRLNLIKQELVSNEGAFSPEMLTKIKLL